MKTQSIVVYLSMIAITVNAEIKLKPPSLTMISSPEERRKFSLFPKSIKKYIFTEKPMEMAQLVTSPMDMRKRTVMPRLLIKSKKIEDATRFVYKEAVTRPTLMKVRKFLIDLSTNEAKLKTPDESEVQISESFENDYEKEEVANDHFLADRAYIETEEKDYDKSVESEENHTEYGIVSEENDTETKNDYGKFIESVKNDSETRSKFEENHMETTAETKAKSENLNEMNMDTTIDASNEHKNEIDFTTESYLSGIAEIESNELGLYKMRTDTIITSSDSLTPEEKYDRNEFIFIKKLAVDSGIPKTKKKRSIKSNIIEEENLGATISGFKFTGREFHLTNDLAYKNINT